MKDSAKLQPELKKKILSENQRALNNFSLGNKGEKIASLYLQQKNYQILDTNIRVKNNEIDIIALDTNLNELVFIEVKTRNSTEFGTPALAVTNSKINSMATVAQKYLQQHYCNLDYRFDIIAISYLGKTKKRSNTSCIKNLGNKKTKTQPQIEHFENITWL